MVIMKYLNLSEIRYGFVHSSLVVPVQSSLHDYFDMPRVHFNCNPYGKIRHKGSGKRTRDADWLQTNESGPQNKHVGKKYRPHSQTQSNTRQAGRCTKADGSVVSD